MDYLSLLPQQVFSSFRPIAVVTADDASSVASVDLSEDTPSVDSKSKLPIPYFHPISSARSDDSSFESDIPSIHTQPTGDDDHSDAKSLDLSNWPRNIHPTHEHAGKLVTFDKNAKIQEWHAAKILSKRKRREGKVEYLCEWEPTWETSGLFEALKDEGYELKLLETRMDPNDTSSKIVKFQLEQQWRPLEDVDEAAIAEFEQEQDQAELVATNNQAVRAVKQSPKKRQSPRKASKPQKKSQPTSFQAMVQYNGKRMHIDTVMETRKWPVSMFQKRRKRRGKVEYLCEFEDTWETEEMVEALKNYRGGYKVTILKTKPKVCDNNISVTSHLCRWAPQWEPEDNLSDDVKQEAILDVMGNRPWSIKNILEERTVGGTVEYLVEWEDTWETEATVEAMKCHKADNYHITVLKTKIRKRGSSSEELSLCRWPNEWIPKSKNLSAGFKKKPLIDLERQQEKPSGAKAGIPKNSAMLTNGNDNSNESTVEMPDSPVENAAAAAQMQTAMHGSSGHEGDIESMGEIDESVQKEESLQNQGGDDMESDGIADTNAASKTVSLSSNPNLFSRLQSFGGEDDNTSDGSDGCGSSTFSIEEDSDEEDYVDPQIPKLVDFIINGNGR
ncbi:MAG: hypothetical protein SGBAC_007211 [Bacillariaceae sp.]